MVNPYWSRSTGPFSRSNACFVLLLLSFYPTCFSFFVCRSLIFFGVLCPELTYLYIYMYICCSLPSHANQTQGLQTFNGFGRSCSTSWSNVPNVWCQAQVRGHLQSFGRSRPICPTNSWQSTLLQFAREFRLGTVSIHLWRHLWAPHLPLLCKSF